MRKIFCDGCDKHIEGLKVNEIRVIIGSHDMVPQPGEGHVYDLCNICVETLRRETNPKSWERADMVRGQT